MIKVETFPVGHIATNCYILIDTESERKAVVDPGYKSAELLSRIKELGVDTFDYILLTHGHFDHIWYASDVQNLTGAKIMISALDAPFLSDNTLNLSSNFGFRNFPEIHADITLEDGDKFYLGKTEFTFLCTSGHTKGSGCYISFADNIIFSGDTLFRQSMGRTDFVTGNSLEMMNSLNRIARLQGDFTVYPGHGEATSLDYERKNNPYVSV